MAQAQALRLMRASLRRGQYPLCCELLRFVVPPSMADGTEPSEPGGGPGAGSGRYLHLPESPCEPLAAAQAVGAGRKGGEPSRDAGAGRADAGPGSQAGARRAGRESRGGEADAEGEGEGEAGGAGAGQRSWLGWFLGYSPEAQPAAPPEPSPPSPPGTGEAPAGEPVAQPSGSPPAARRPPAAAEAAPSLSAGSAATARAACGLVAEHAWALLEAGHLGSLGQLGAAAAFLPGGLAGLMAAHRDSGYAAKGCGAHSPLGLLTSLVRQAARDGPRYTPVTRGGRVCVAGRVEKALACRPEPGLPAGA